jgi:uncharacterized membrane protein YcaP (DUF421 family)
MDLDLTGIVFRVSIMYVYALALVRIAGKQSLGQLTPMDFVVTLIIGDLFDDIFWAELERIRAEDVQFELRLKGEEHMREIKEARLEPCGQVSVIKDPAYKPVPKKDERLFR